MASYKNGGIQLNYSNSIRYFIFLSTSTSMLVSLLGFSVGPFKVEVKNGKVRGILGLKGKQHKMQIRLRSDGTWATNYINRGKGTNLSIFIMTKDNLEQNIKKLFRE